jgi:uncharacterized small protein (DUF1192 family)
VLHRASMSIASLTYPEIASRFGMTTASARNLVRRKGWNKTLGNDGLARIMVPSDAVPDEPPMRAEGSTVQPSEPGDGATVQPLDGASLVAVAALERHVARLEGEIATLKDVVSTLITEREAACEQAIALRISISGLEATSAALRDEIARRDSRGWWRRLTRR